MIWDEMEGDGALVAMHGGKERGIFVIICVGGSDGEA